MESNGTDEQPKELLIEARHTISLAVAKKKREHFATSLFLPTYISRHNELSEKIQDENILKKRMQSVCKIIKRRESICLSSRINWDELSIKDDKTQLNLPPTACETFFYSEKSEEALEDNKDMAKIRRDTVKKRGANQNSTNAEERSQQESSNNLEIKEESDIESDIGNANRNDENPTAEDLKDTIQLKQAKEQNKTTFGSRKWDQRFLPIINEPPPHCSTPKDDIIDFKSIEKDLINENNTLTQIPPLTRIESTTNAFKQNSRNTSTQNEPIPTISPDNIDVENEFDDTDFNLDDSLNIAEYVESVIKELIEWDSPISPKNSTKVDHTDVLEQRQSVITEPLSKNNALDKSTQLAVELDSIKTEPMDDDIETQKALDDIMTCLNSANSSIQFEPNHSIFSFEEEPISNTSIINPKNARLTVKKDIFDKTSGQIDPKANTFDIKTQNRVNVIQHTKPNQKDSSNQLPRANLQITLPNMVNNADVDGPRNVTSLQSMPTNTPNGPTQINPIQLCNANLQKTLPDMVKNPDVNGPRDVTSLQSMPTNSPNGPSEINPNQSRNAKLQMTLPNMVNNADVNGPRDVTSLQSNPTNSPNGPSEINPIQLPTANLQKTLPDMVNNPDVNGPSNVTSLQSKSTNSPNKPTQVNPNQLPTANLPKTLANMVNYADATLLQSNSRNFSNGSIQINSEENGHNGTIESNSSNDNHAVAQCGSVSMKNRLDNINSTEIEPSVITKTLNHILKTGVLPHIPNDIKTCTCPTCESQTKAPLLMTNAIGNETSVQTNSLMTNAIKNGTSIQQNFLTLTMPEQPSKKPRTNIRNEKTSPTEEKPKPTPKRAPKSNQKDPPNELPSKLLQVTFPDMLNNPKVNASRGAINLNATTSAHVDRTGNLQMPVNLNEVNYTERGPINFNQTSTYSTSTFTVPMSHSQPQNNFVTQPLTTNPPLFGGPLFQNQARIIHQDNNYSNMRAMLLNPQSQQRSQAEVSQGNGVSFQSQINQSINSSENRLTNNIHSQFKRPWEDTPLSLRKRRANELPSSTQNNGTVLANKINGPMLPYANGQANSFHANFNPLLLGVPVQPCSRESIDHRNSTHSNINNLPVVNSNIQNINEAQTPPSAQGNQWFPESNNIQVGQNNIVFSQNQMNPPSTPIVNEQVNNINQVWNGTPGPIRRRRASELPRDTNYLGNTTHAQNNIMPVVNSNTQNVSETQITQASKRNQPYPGSNNIQVGQNNIVGSQNQMSPPLTPIVNGQVNNGNQVYNGTPGPNRRRRASVLPQDTTHLQYNILPVVNSNTQNVSETQITPASERNQPYPGSNNIQVAQNDIVRSQNQMNPPLIPTVNAQLNKMLPHVNQVWNGTPGLIRRRRASELPRDINYVGNTTHPQNNILPVVNSNTQNVSETQITQASERNQPYPGSNNIQVTQNNIVGSQNQMNPPLIPTVNGQLNKMLPHVNQVWNGTSGPIRTHRASELPRYTNYLGNTTHPQNNILPVVNSTIQNVSETQITPASERNQPYPGSNNIQVAQNNIVFSQNQMSSPSTPIVNGQVNNGNQVCNGTPGPIRRGRASMLPQDTTHPRYNILPVVNSTIQNVSETQITPASERNQPYPGSNNIQVAQNDIVGSQNEMNPPSTPIVNGQLNNTLPNFNQVWNATPGLRTWRASELPRETIYSGNTNHPPNIINLPGVNSIIQNVNETQIPPSAQGNQCYPASNNIQVAQNNIVGIQNQMNPPSTPIVNGQVNNINQVWNGTPGPIRRRRASVLPQDTTHPQNNILPVVNSNTQSVNETQISQASKRNQPYPGSNNIQVAQNNIVGIQNQMNPPSLPIANGQVNNMLPSFNQVWNGTPEPIRRRRASELPRESYNLRTIPIVSHSQMLSKDSTSSIFVCKTTMTPRIQNVNEVPPSVTRGFQSSFMNHVATNNCRMELALQNIQGVHPTVNEQNLDRTELASSIQNPLRLLRRRASEFPRETNSFGPPRWNSNLNQIGATLQNSHSQRFSNSINSYTEVINTQEQNNQLANPSNFQNMNGMQPESIVQRAVDQQLQHNVGAVNRTPFALQQTGASNSLNRGRTH